MRKQELLSGSLFMAAMSRCVVFFGVFFGGMFFFCGVGFFVCVWFFLFFFPSPGSV